MKISILGAGNAGISLSGHFAMLGHDIYLYEFKDFSNNINRIKEDLTIKITGVVNGIGKIKKASSNMEEIINDTEIIILAVPSNYRDIYYKQLIKYVKDGQLIVLMPDNYGSFDLYNELKKVNLENRVMIAGVSSCIYACRKIDNNTSDIKGIKNMVLLSSINGYTNEANEKLNSILPLFEKTESVYEVCLSNLNCIVHTAATIMNTGWIETTKGRFDFYGDGISPSVAKIIQKIDEERIAVGKKLGLNLKNLLDSMKSIYNSKQKNIYKALTKSNVHVNAFAPESIKCRYITEDVPYGLKPISELGKKFDVNTEVIDSIITITKWL